MNIANHPVTVTGLGTFSFTVANAGAKNVKGTITLPTAPLHLAHASRAALLPVFTIRAADGTYDVTIERPLDVDSDVTYANAARTYAAMLEQYVTAHPAQWRGWESLIVVPALADND